MSYLWKNIPIKKNLCDHVLRVHKAIGELKCTLCSKTFNDKSKLNSHTLTVHGPKDKECDSCDMKFTNNGDMKKHYDRVHLKIVKFKCDICSKFLASKPSLRFHKKSVHENKKDYECDLCKKCFTQPIHLQSHKTRAHTDKAEKRLPIWLFKCYSNQFQIYLSQIFKFFSSQSFLQKGLV